MSSTIGAKPINPFENVQLKSNVNKAQFQDKTEKALSDGVLTKEEFLSIKDDLNLKPGFNLEAILKELPSEKDVAAALGSKQNMSALQERAEKVLPELRTVLDSESQPITFVQPKTRADAFVRQVRAIENSAPQETLPEIKSKDELLAKIKDPDLKKDISDFLAKFPDSNEALNNLNQVLFGHKPPLKDAEKADVIGKLLQLADETGFPTNINPKELALTALKNIANSDSISMADPKTSMGASTQAIFAKVEPAKYLQALWSIAIGNTNADLSAVGSKNGKSITDNIFQPQISNPQAVEKTLPSIKYIKPDSAKGMANIIAALSPSVNNPVPVTFGNTVINVIGMDKQKGTFSIIDPQGNKKEITEKDLSKATGVFIPVAMEKELADMFGINNPLLASVQDVGVSKFKKINADSRTKDDLKTEILDKMAEGPLKTSVIALAEKLPTKMSMVYLQHLLFERTPAISEEKKLELVNKLNEMTKTKYMDGVDNKALIEAALHDVAAPQDIAQEEIGNCAGTSVQIELAIRDPQKYLNMLDKLAQNQGFVTGNLDKNNKPIIINTNNTFLDEGKEGKLDSKRTISSKIMQNAIMAFDNEVRKTIDGKEYKYDSSSKDEEINSGLVDASSLEVKKALYGGTGKVYNNEDYSPRQLVSILEKAKPSEDNPIQISLSYTDKGRDSNHAVDVIGLDKNNVTIINPWGRVETIDIKTFHERILSVIAGDKLAEKMEDKDFKTLLGNPAELVKTVNSKGEEFISTLKLDQKVQLIAALSSSGATPPENAKAILNVLNNILQGTDVQNKMITSNIHKALKAENVDLSAILNKVQSDDPLFNKVLANSAVALPDDIKQIAKELINDPDKGPKFIAGLDYEKKANIISELLKISQGAVTRAAVDKLLTSIVSEKGYTPEKLIADLDPEAKAFVLSSMNPSASKMFGGISTEQQVKIIQNITAAIANEKTKAEQKPILQNSVLNFVEGMIKGKDPVVQKSILEKLAIGLGRGNDSSRSDAKSLEAGIKSLTNLLPHGNPTDKILGIINPAAALAGGGVVAEQKNSNPLNAQLSDIGNAKFVTALNDKSITPAVLKAQILSKFEGSPIKEKVIEFDKKLHGNKEALIYLNYLVSDRKPALNAEQIGNILDKLNTMLGPDTKYPKLTKDMNISPEKLKKDLVISALHDIAAPQDISQNDIGSCAGTCVQIKLAINDPIRYLNMVDKLAKNENFEAIAPNFSFTNEGKKGNQDTGRTLSCKIMQNAIMDFGDGASRSYNSASTKKEDNYGMAGKGTSDVRNAIFTGVTAREFNNRDYTPKQLMSFIDEAKPSAENPIQITMIYNNKKADGTHAIHAVNVVGIDKTNNTVSIINPWGREETFPLAVLQERILGVIDTNSHGPTKLIDDDVTKLVAAGKGEIIKNINSKGDEFIQSLTFDQKIKIIATLTNSGDLSAEDKKAALKVLNSMLVGNNDQDKYLAFDIYDGLSKAGAAIYPNLINALKSDDPQFYSVAADLCKIYPVMSMAADLLNDPAIGPKFLQSLNNDDKASILGNLCANYPTGTSVQNAGNAISSVAASINSDSKFDLNKLVSNMDGKAMAFLHQVPAAPLMELVSKFSPDQKVNIFVSISEAQTNPDSDQQYDFLRNGALLIVNSLIKGKSPDEQAEILKKLVISYGQYPDNNRTEKEALEKGKEKVIESLPPPIDKQGKDVKEIKDMADLINKVK